MLLSIAFGLLIGGIVWLLLHTKSNDAFFFLLFFFFLD